jgi:hypothetical protein
MKNKDQILIENIYNSMNNPIETLKRKINHATKTGNKAELTFAYEEVRRLALRHPNLLKDPNFLDIVPEDLLNELQLKR